MKRVFLVMTVLALAVPSPGTAQTASPSPSPSPSGMPSFGAERIKFGDRFMAQKNYRQAEQEYRSATLIDPTNFEAAVGLADAMYMRQNHREALKEYQRALRLIRPTYAQVPYAEAARLNGLGRWREALRFYRRVAHIKPEAGEMVEKGVAALQAGDTAGAKKAFTEALKLDPDYADAFYKLANIAYDDKDYLTAIDLLEKAIAADPEDGLIYFKLGNAYHHFKGQTPKGEKYQFYREWDRKERDEKWRTWCLNRAVTAYRKANQFQPDDFDILHNLGSTELDLGRGAQAAQALEKAVRLQNDDVDVHTQLGNAYYLLAKDLPAYNKAIHQYRVALVLDPTRRELERNLGHCYLQKAKIRPRSDQFEITKENANFYMSKGGSYHRTDMLTRAHGHFTTYLEKLPRGDEQREVTEKLLKDLAQETSRSVQKQ